MTKYSSLAATVTWTLLWLAPAVLAARRFTTTHDGSSLLCVIVAGALAAFGCLMTVVTFRRIPTKWETKDQPETEPWSRRVVGWFAEFVWCTVAGLWNLGIEVWLIRAAIAGQVLTLVILIPFSLIGWFLLLVRFVSIGLAIDSFFQ